MIKPFALSVLSVFVLGLAQPASAQSARNCQTGQMIVADNYDAPATMTVRSGSSCRRNFKSTSFKLKEIQFLERPKHGTLVKEGWFSYRYIANKGYVGSDSFAIRYVGDKVLRDGSKAFASYQGLRWTVNVVP